MSDLRNLVRSIPDYPKPGIIFRDVTTLFADPDGMRRIVDEMAAPFRDDKIDCVAGIDARGFILGGALAVTLGTGFVAVRKKGKLPADVYREEYSLEYGVDEVEIHVDALPDGARVLLVDDLIATGGTATAAARLIERVGGSVPAAAFAIELPDLGGVAALKDMGIDVYSIMAFEGD
ncbi:MAG: adenine phosphoribosyltransferase [Pseudomonadota bacterium]